MKIYAYDNLEDGITGKKISVAPYADFYRIRVKFKEGVEEFRNVFGQNLSMINNGIEEDFIYPTGSTSEIIPVGSESVLYINTRREKREVSKSYLLLSGSNLSTFLSLLDTLYDPLPFFCNTDQNIKVDSENFKAPNGVFSTPSSPFFNNSTFKVAPKIWSNEALDGVFSFPPSRYTIAPVTSSSSLRAIPYAPFAQCPNLEKIEKQGIIGENVKILGMTDFTFKDSDGYIDLSAYPECKGEPIVVTSYIPAMPNESVRLSSIPNTLINTSKIEKLFLPFKFKNYIIDDTISNLQLPLAGLDFKDKEMSSLTLDNFNFKLESSLISDEAKDFTLTLPMLGIVAPSSCQIVENIHTLHMSLSDKGEYEGAPNNEDWIQWAQGNKNTLLTPDYIADNVSFGWGENLKTYLDENELWDYIDENCLPLLPDGLIKITNYMAKNFILNEPFVKFSTVNKDYLENTGYDTKKGEFIVFSDNQRLLEKDGQPFTFKMKPIVLNGTGSGKKQITGAYRNLYSLLYLDEEITVPEVPQDCNFIIGYGQGLFANSQGFGGEYIERDPEDKGKAIVSWCKSFYKERTANPTTSNFGANRVQDLELATEILEAIDNKNSSYHFVILANRYDTAWNEIYVPVSGKTRPESTANTRNRSGTAYASYDNPNWNPNGSGSGEWAIDESFRINDSQELLELIEEYKNKYEISVRINKFRFKVNFPQGDMRFADSLSNNFNQVLFGAAVNFDIQENYPRVGGVTYSFQNLARAFVARNYYFTVVFPHTFLGYVERDDLEYSLPGGVPGENRLTTCYFYNIALYFNNFKAEELEEAGTLFPGFDILESFAPDNNTTYSKNYQQSVNSELFPKNYNTQAQAILNTNQVKTSLATITSFTDTQFLNDRAYSVTFEYSAAYDYKYAGEFEHRIKNPSLATSINSTAFKCHIMNIWTNTYERNLPSNVYFRTRNRIADVWNFAGNVSMSPTNSNNADPDSTIT